ncbi:DNA replication protein DnaC [Gracilibacillus alcaliphilus]|nr:ATP-binding protein [Gracilibacillus alcaliphilus]MBM7677378.1 DNA replication protein DnaC [Gracilibacillus alcaliphilus]
MESILAKELELRVEAKVERLIKKAHFLQEKPLSSFQWHDQIHFPPRMDAKELERLHFIQVKENLILTGSPGTGKTHLATAIGYEALQDRSGNKVLQCI